LVDVVVLSDAAWHVEVAPEIRLTVRLRADGPDQIDDTVILEGLVDEPPLLARRGVEVSADEPTAIEHAARALLAVELRLHLGRELCEPLARNDILEHDVAVFGKRLLERLDLGGGQPRFDLTVARLSSGSC
jgi:hypothetical protein